MCKVAAISILGKNFRSNMKKKSFYKNFDLAIGNNFRKIESLDGNEQS